MGVGAAAAPKRGHIWCGGVQTHLLMPRRAAAANRLAVMAMTREERTLQLHAADACRGNPADAWILGYMVDTIGYCIHVVGYL